MRQVRIHSILNQALTMRYARGEFRLPDNFGRRSRPVRWHACDTSSCSASGNIVTGQGCSQDGLARALLIAAKPSKQM
ncbi:hypothetical protein BDW68DRAFT_150070 [Aspergillus falconensis]